MEQIRWEQRFQNLEKAYDKLCRGLKIFDYQKYLEKRSFLKEKQETKESSAINEELERLDLDREGIVQRFEYCFELFLQTLKDYLKYTGETEEELKGNRAILKNALQNGLIKDHDNWRNMLISRNLTSHTYDEETADEITQKIIQTYFPLMDKLYATLKEKYGK